MYSTRLWRRSSPRSGGSSNGLELMRSYLDSANRDALVQGIRTVWEGSQKIYQVQRMGVAVEKLAAEREAAAAEARENGEDEEPSEEESEA